MDFFVCLLSCQYYYYTTYSCEMYYCVQSGLPPTAMSASSSMSSSSSSSKTGVFVSSHAIIEDYWIDGDDEEDGTSFGFGLKTSRYATQQYSIAGESYRVRCKVVVCVSRSRISKFTIAERRFYDRCFRRTHFGGTQIK